MTHTPTVPLDDKTMWRKALARTHPDAGGEHELFIWIQEVRDAMCNDGGSFTEHRPPRWEPRPEPEPRIVHEDGRVLFPEFTDFADLTRRALAAAEETAGIYARPLRLLHDCRPIEWLAREQERGASFKQLASIGHAFGMNGRERGTWYEIAKSIPLSQRHAGHIISKLKGQTG